MFYKWFITFLEEKQIDLGDFCDNGKQVGDVCQAICNTTAGEQAKIKDVLVQIDFAGGDVYSFLNHLSQAL